MPLLCRPDRAIGARTRLILQEEERWAEPSRAQRALAWEFATESLRSERRETPAQHVLGRGRVARAPLKGRDDAAGDVNGLVQPHGAWPLVVRHALGGAVSTVGSGPYVHTVRGSDTLPAGLTVEKRFGLLSGSTLPLRYYGCLVDQLQIRIPSSGLATARARLVAREERVASRDLDLVPDYPVDNEPFSSVQGAVRMDLDGDGVTEAVAIVQSIDFTVNNRVTTDSYGPKAGRARLSVQARGRQTLGTMQVFFTAQTWALYGRSLRDCFGEIDVTLTRAPWAWRFRFPSASLSVPTPQTSDRGPLSLSVGFFADYDPATGSDVTAVLTNADPLLSTSA